jgi:hypothetical protein
MESCNKVTAAAAAAAKSEETMYIREDANGEGTAKRDRSISTQGDVRTRERKCVRTNHRDGI